MNPTQQEKEIKEIKERIDDLKDYVSSDCCKSCANYYKEIEALEQKLKELEQ